MSASTFERGTNVLIDGSSYRVNRRLVDGDWQLEESKTGRFITLSEREIHLKIADATLAFPGNGVITRVGPANSKLSEKDFEIAKLRRAYVKRVLNVPNTRKALESAIAEIRKVIEQPTKVPSYSTVYRWKRRYLAAKEDIRALVDNTSAKGNRSSRYEPEVLAICRQAIESRWMRRERSTVQDALDEAIFRISKENALRPQELTLRTPSRRLIDRLIAEIPAIDKHAARYGREAARKIFRSQNGHVITNRPLERAEIDHTVLDLFVVDDRTRLPLGRPYVTACIDDYTRCILGVYVGFTPPSFRTVAHCLKDCFLPKVRLREQYPDVKSDWPAHGVMRELVLDNGQEFHSSSLEQVCLSLDITMRYSPRRTPWAKGKIERFFGTLNRGIAHGNPGTTFSNIFDKGDYDPAKHAVITLSTLQNGVRKFIGDVYHQQTHSSLQATPVEMWNSSVRFEDVRFPDITTELDAIMGTSHPRVLTHKGIEFEGLIYNSNELRDWRGIAGHKLEVEIRVDESNIGSIYMLIPNSSKAIRVPCLNQDYADGISLWQHTEFKKRAKRSSFKLNERGWLQAKKDIQAMFEQDRYSKSRGSRKRIVRHMEDSSRNSQQEDPTDHNLAISSSPTATPVGTAFEALQLVGQETKDHLTFATVALDDDDDVRGFEPIYRGENTVE